MVSDELRRIIGCGDCTERTCDGISCLANVVTALRTQLAEERRERSLLGGEVLGLRAQLAAAQAEVCLEGQADAHGAVCEVERERDAFRAECARFQIEVQKWRANADSAAAGYLRLEAECERLRELIGICDTHKTLNYVLDGGCEACDKEYAIKRAAPAAGEGP